MNYSPFTNIKTVAVNLETSSNANLYTATRRSMIISDIDFTSLAGGTANSISINITGTQNSILQRIGILSGAINSSDGYGGKIIESGQSVNLTNSLFIRLIGNLYVFEID